jgi:tetratricopeptide (TPR) repeat protein
LAQGYARLESDAAEALSAATRATALEPTRAAPRLLLARALVAQGRMPEAFQAFQQVLQQPGAPELSPAGLHAYALAAVGSGDVERGLAAYRRLVPMASLLTSLGASERVYVEAAVLVMLREPQLLQESVAYLNEARRQNASLALRPFVLSALALALDRQGRHEEARGVAREAHGHTGLLVGATESPPSSGTLQAPTASGGTLRVPLPRIDPIELLAMTAMLTAIDDPELAKQYWRDFVERAPPGHPWLAHARGKLALRG